jgi:hypothetical protein
MGYGLVRASIVRMIMKSRNSPWRAVPGLFFLLAFACFFGVKAAGEKDAATRQQTSFGLVTECTNGAHGGHSCHYSFSAGDEQYIGVSQADSDVVFGRNVTVYYDSEDPTINALEDFSDKSRTDENWLYIFLMVIVVFAALIFYFKVPFQNSTRRTT